MRGATDLASTQAIWRFNEAAAASDALDHTGAGNTLTRAGSPDVIAGTIDGARRTATGKSFSRADAGKTFAPAALSVRVYFRVTAYPAASAAVVHRGTDVFGAGGGGWLLYVTSAGALRVAMRGDLSGIDTLTDEILAARVDLKRWYHVAITHSGGTDAPSAGGTLRVWLDGVHVLEKASVARKLTTSDETLYVGLHGANALPMDVEDLALDNAALTDDEVHHDARLAAGHAGHASLSITGALTDEQTLGGLSGVITHIQSATIPAPRTWEPVPEPPSGNGQPLEALLMLALVERLSHLACRGLKLVHSRTLDPAATDVVGPTALAYLRWTASPRAEAIVVRALCLPTDDIAALTPKLYVDGDTANAAKLIGYVPSANARLAVLELHHALVPGAVKELVLNAADKLRVRALAVFERPRDALDVGALYVSPDAYQRGHAIHEEAVARLYWAVRDLHRLQQGIYFAGGLDEDLAGTVVTSSSYVNVRDTTKTSWTWAAPGWIADPLLRGHGMSGHAWARCMVRCAATNPTTIRFRTSQGYVDISVPGGAAAAWYTAASLLPLASPRDREMVQVFASTGGAAATITGLTCEGASDI